jgi:hypothetical protein
VYKVLQLVQRDAMLPVDRQRLQADNLIHSHHARTWKGIPAQANAISLFNVIPLLLEGIEVHI